MCHFHRGGFTEVGKWILCVMSILRALESKISAIEARGCYFGHMNFVMRSVILAWVHDHVRYSMLRFVRGIHVRTGPCSREFWMLKFDSKA